MFGIPTDMPQGGRYNQKTKKQFLPHEHLKVKGQDRKKSRCTGRDKGKKEEKWKSKRSFPENFCFG